MGAILILTASTAGPVQAQMAPARFDSIAAWTPPPLVDGAPARRVRSHRLLGAGIGFVTGGGITYLVLHQGDSTAPCDREANQDAWSAGACWAATAGGALVGAGIGALIAGLFGADGIENAPIDRLHVGWTPRAGARAAISLPF